MLCPLLHQGWSSHTMRQWPMLHTRKGRQHRLQKQVSQKEKGQQPVLRQALPILGIPSVVLSYSQFHYFIMYNHLTNTHFFLLFTQNLELDPMTLFFSKFCNPSLFFKTPGALKPQNIQGRHQGRSVPSRKNLHKRGLLQLWQPARPAPLQIPEARSNSSLNKV